MTNQEVIDKVKKLLALSESDNENEAKSALLMAQKLMAKYNINVETTGEETIAYSKEICQHRYDAAYRKPLGRVIADNFRCEMYLHGGHITFFGRASFPLIIITVAAPIEMPWRIILMSLPKLSFI